MTNIWMSPIGKHYAILERRGYPGEETIMTATASIIKYAIRKKMFYRYFKKSKSISQIGFPGFKQTLL